MRTWRIAGLILLALLPSSWSNQTSTLAFQQPDQEPPPKDSWYRHPPTEMIIDPVKKTVVKWTDVDPTQVYGVVRQKWPKAEAMLEKQWFYKLTIDQAREFAGKAVLKRSDKTPYLVPAVYYEGGTGKFYVGTLGKHLWISHQSLGPWPAAMKRDALVVFLKTEPALLFVTCERIE